MLPPSFKIFEKNRTLEGTRRINNEQQIDDTRKGMYLSLTNHVNAVRFKCDEEMNGQDQLGEVVHS